MALLLGVDTGGTYTDAVLIRDGREVLASAKALTTRSDLAVGIGGAVRAVLTTAKVAPEDVALASLSTTLATNALVEGQGGRVGLVYIGFSTRDLERNGLSDALRGDPVLILNGGHSHAGDKIAPLDLDSLSAWLETISGVSAFAVAAHFATRNPAHEIAAALVITRMTGRPVSCSHHLSPRLNGPKRAVTALLNARLIGLTHRLIGRAEDVLQRIGIHAPLMVVRGDGALMSAAQARDRPIETILSGPAASIVGARWLTGVKDAMVSDIGGTTTDIAVLRHGRPAIDPLGAQVGPYRTMVEAVAMRTFGLGGDSQVHVIADGLDGGITLGPRRVLPVSLVATEAPDVVHAALDAQLRNSYPGEYDGCFVKAVNLENLAGLGSRESDLPNRIGAQVHPLGAVLRSRLDGQALQKLIARGLVQQAGVTPSDASHVLQRHDAWDQGGCDQGIGAFGAPQNRRGLQGHRGLISLQAGLGVNLIALGASAASYYPAVGQRLNTHILLPDHAAVANAIGAVVGQVAFRKSGTVTAQNEGVYRVHLEDGPRDLQDPEVAMQMLEVALRQAAKSEAILAGAADVHVVMTRDIRHAEIEGRKVFLEAVLTVEASGRPRLAVDLP